MYQEKHYVPWKRMMKLIPIRKSQFNYTNKCQRAAGRMKEIELPKLSGTRLMGTSSVPRSPLCGNNRTSLNKSFSPILARGLYSRTTNRD